MKIAYVRGVPDSINDCELTFLRRVPIDVARARHQHRQYVELLTTLGIEVCQLPVAHDAPDSVFVEDTALVLDEIAIITRPGAPSRRGEVEAVARVLAVHRECVRIEAPTTVDGGDITVVGRRIFIGTTTRSTDQAGAVIRKIVGVHGYSVESVEVSGCLHLKSAVTAIGPNAVLLNPEYVDRAVFEGMEVIETDSNEPEGANALLIDEVLVYGAEYPRTLARLESAGYVTHTVAASELAKAEGAVTCCSLIVDV